MNRIKILHLIPTLSSGGAERQLVNLVNSTSAKEFNHVVCTIGEAGFFAPVVRQAGYKVIEMNISANRPFFQTARKFRQIIREEQPDIINSWLFDASIGARLARLPGNKIPIVTSLQSSDYAPEARQAGNWSPKKVAILRLIDKFTALLAKPYFVPCSEFVKKSYQIHFGIDEAKTEVIYNSVDADLLAATADDVKKIREELMLPPDAFIYISVGRLDAAKNHKILLEAFRKVLAEVPVSYLIMVGAGMLENDLKKQAEDLQIAERVLFLGQRNDVGALLETADVFVFPSLLEGLPVALVEAMSKSLPCIASKIEVFEEVIDEGENGLLINPHSSDELKGAMIKLYADENLRKSLGEKAFQTVNAKFSVKVTAQKWESFYKKVKFGL